MDHQQLSQILAYENQDVISRFTDMMDIPQQEAEDIFLETKKFLYLSQIPGIFIPDELLIIDEMWHNFVLFTKDYNDFCLNNFGRFVHHQPATYNEKQTYREKKATDPDGTTTEFNQKLEIMLSATYDNFGQDTVMKWFGSYAEKYSPSNIKILRKH